MLLTLTTTHRPATDLGFLLEKHPERCQSFALSFGQAHVFYPEASAERCSAALLLDLDPIGLVRGRRQGEGFTLAAYVNDRPYVASSFLSVAIAQVFGSALGGRSRERAELAQQALPLQARVSAVRTRGGEALVRRLFEPLGYRVAVESHALDCQYPDWGPSPYLSLALEGSQRLSDLLGHLYVLLPVLDGDKHYFVGTDEVDKLLAKAEGWLGTHPERDLITARFLKHQKALTRDALSRLVAEDETDTAENEESARQEEERIERKVRLDDLRLAAVVEALKSAGAQSVVDLGCGEGRLLRELGRDKSFSRIVGVDVSMRALERASQRLGLIQAPARVRERFRLLQSSLCYRDARLSGFDAACAVEVIEHLEPARVAAFERVLFAHARPKTVVITTPNVEYNVRFEGLPAGRFRHRDHRFEWTRAEFSNWAERVAATFGYAVRVAPVGPQDPEVGAPTQMAVFSQ